MQHQDVDKKKKVRSTDANTVALHWILAITLFFSLSTGLRISADAEDSVWARMLGFLQLQGDVMRWHVWAAFALTLVAVAYVFFLRRARLQSRVALDSARVRGLFGPDAQTRWAAINVLIYWIAYAMIAAAAVTGTLLYFLPGVLPHGVVIWIHAMVAWFFIAYIFVHIIAQFAMGGLRHLLKILNPRMAYGAVTLVAITAAGVSAASIYAIDKAAMKDLRVIATSEPPTVDGDVGDAAWKEAPAVDIHTERGANQPGGEVTVTVRAVHDGDKVYTLFEWPDSTRSQKHLPLVKTEQGWKVVHTEFDIQDEDDYYEDKFAVMLSSSSELAGSGSVHLGPQPLKYKPGAAGGRGLHYTTDNSIVDVWHWKSVRTGSELSHQADDNYFGPPMEPNPKKKRYTGGYTQDPHTGGGYSMNWAKFDTGIVELKRLPKDPSLLDRMGKVDLDAKVSDDGEFWMPVSMTVPYDKALDTYPVGTYMPSVLIEGPREGDRGDVTAVARWSDGWWRVEMARDLDTGSKYDVALTKPRPVICGSPRLTTLRLATACTCVPCASWSSNRASSEHLLPGGESAVPRAKASKRQDSGTSLCG